MQTDARALLNLAAEERQQLSALEALLLSRRGGQKKNFLGKFPTEFVRRETRVPLSRIFRLHVSTAQDKSVSFPCRYWFRALPSVWPPLYFANLASPSAFSLTPSSPPPLSPFLLSRQSLSLFSSRQTHRAFSPRYFRVWKKRMERSVEERRREMKFEETSI